MMKADTAIFCELEKCHSASAFFFLAAGFALTGLCLGIASSPGMERAELEPAGTNKVLQFPHRMRPSGIVSYGSAFLRHIGQINVADPGVGLWVAGDVSAGSAVDSWARNCKASISTAASEISRISSSGF